MQNGRTAEIDRLRAKNAKLIYSLEEMMSAGANLKAENAKLRQKVEELREALTEAKGRLRDPYGYFLRDSAKKDNCGNCGNMKPCQLQGNSDRISCKYAEGWPHWSHKCKYWIAKSENAALRLDEIARGQFCFEEGV
uniref:Uncharacterized protein n=1 Tax=viral metagenome TaxID=1070528 RepID=A0A6M3LKH5_9ZZZZ